MAGSVGYGARRAVPATAEGIIGPSKLLVAASNLPLPGTSVIVSGGGHDAPGTILTRIRRAVDIGGAIHLAQAEDCERLLAASTLTVTSTQSVAGLTPIGVVDAASTHTTLVFSPTQPIRVGDVVAVPSVHGAVLYQLAKGEVVEFHVRVAVIYMCKHERLNLASLMSQGSICRSTAGCRSLAHP